MAMYLLFGALNARETDPQIEIVLPTLLKRSADTNQFISESALQALNQIIEKCTDTRVFS